MNFKKRYKSHHDSTVFLKNKFTKNINTNQYLNELLDKNAEKDRAIYIHVPYCSKICSFCNLNTNLINNKISDYHKLIIDSIKQISKYNYIQSKKFESIYFGGGTPTTLSSKQLKLILEALNNYLPISKNAEISLETSITELSKAKLEILADKGVNRLSIGVQSFNDRARKILGRRGNGKKAIEKIREVMEMGFKNTNIDLIYNYPGQTIEEINYDLSLINELDIAGLSFYSLILHEGSKLFRQIKNAGKYQIPDLEKEKILFKKIYGELQNSGYKLFELTKMIKEKRDKYKYIQIKNNCGDVLALGVGAGGRLGQYIYYNGDYNILKQTNKPISTMGRVVRKEYNLIYKILGDIQFGKLKFKYNSYELKNILTNYFTKLKEEDLIIKRDNKFIFSEEGIFWGNNISRDITKLIINYFENDQLKLYR